MHIFHSLRCERGTSVAAAHKEVEAEKCHSARRVTSTRRPRGDEVSQRQGRGLTSSPQPRARHHQSHWHPLTFLCICLNVPLPPSVPPPPQEDLFTSMAYASPRKACLSLSLHTSGWVFIKPDMSSTYRWLPSFFTKRGSEKKREVT